MSSKHSIVVILNLSIIVLVFSILAFVELPDSSYLWIELHNLGHTPLFGIVAIALLGVTKELVGENYPVIIQYMISSTIAFILGLVWELIQIPTAGDADMTDLARNGAGILGMMLLKLALDQSYWLRRNKQHWRVRGKYYLFGIAVLTIATIPLMIWTAAYVERGIDFPNLSRFDSFLGRKFIVLMDCNLEPTSPPPGWQDGPSHQVARLVLKPKEMYPGIELGDPVPNWREYSYLGFDIYSSADSQISLIISIEDAEHDQEYGDRFNSQIEILPGMCTSSDNSDICS